ncbi:MAG TPA: hypothetical protein VGK23_11780 [Methanomassiliicoccales archaeon]|jgi:hypothetical protein
MTGSDNGAIVIVVASMPLMAYRLLRSYLRVKVSAKKASKVFYRSLLASGLPKREAKALRDEYGAGMSLTSLIRELSAKSR